MPDKRPNPNLPPPDQPLEDKVRELICEQLSASPDEVTMDASFVNDLNADSLDMVELTMAIEEEFGFEVSEEQAEQLQTVSDAVAFIEQRVES